MSDYTITNILLGQGSFGVIWKGYNKHTNQQVAVKVVTLNPLYQNREVRLLEILCHPNIVKLYDSWQIDKEQFYAMELFDTDLAWLLRERSLKPAEIKQYSRCLFSGLEYIHAQTICHRDIKPENLLVNPDHHILKIGDFGCAKQLFPDKPNIGYVCSRSYRAPELFLENTFYDCTIDMWSAGCVLYELHNRRVLFPAGKTSECCLHEIVKILGTPSQDTLDEMSCQFPETIPVYHRQPLYHILDNMPHTMMQLVSRLICWNPKHRLCAADVLKDVYFNTCFDGMLQSYRKEINDLIKESASHDMILDTFDRMKHDIIDQHERELIACQRINYPKPHISRDKWPSPKGLVK